MKIIDGKATATEIKSEIKSIVAKMIDEGKRPPHLAAILVGDDPASQTYVNSKAKTCQDVGFTSSLYRQEADVTEAELLKLIDFLNNDHEVDGFIVQLPLPKHISVQKVLNSVAPHKDVDGFHPVNVGRMLLGEPTYLPATPFGIMQLIERYGIETEGKNCVVLGRSNIVGTPMGVLLSRNASPGNCTVTLCHSRTQNLKAIAANADILIAAIGKPGFVTADMVKDNAVVIDVGIHRIPSDKTKSGFKLTGDVSYDEVASKCSYITPVPGGVGPMTIAGLLLNTLKAAQKEITY